MTKIKEIKPLGKDILRVLKRIQASIPTEWLEKLVEKKPIAPTMKFAFEKALNDPNVSEELKKKAQTMLDSGYLDKEVDVINKRYETYIGKFIDNEIELATKRGELPKSGKKNRNLGKKLKRIINLKK